MSITLSACMICKNEEPLLAKTLPSLVSVLDEVIVVDTGSTDNSVKIAKSLGATVYSFEWINDFSAARNFSLSKATTDWIMWPDSDEFIFEEDLKYLKKQLESTTEDSLKLHVLECPVGGFTPTSDYFRLKVFKNHCNIHFRRPFNEQLFKGDAPLTSTTHCDKVRLHHWGNLNHIDENKRELKLKRNLKFLRKLLKECPTDSGYHFTTAVVFDGLNHFDRTVHHLREALYHTGDSDPSFTLMLEENLLDRLYLSKQFTECSALCRKMLAHHPNKLDIINKLCFMLIQKKHYEEALSIMTPVLPQLDPDQDHADTVQTKDTLYINLGLCYFGINNYEKSFATFEKAITVNPETKAKAYLTTLKRNVPE